VNEKQKIPVIRDATCAGCGHPVDYEFGREPVNDGRTVWHFKCYLTAPDPQRPTEKYTLVGGPDPAHVSHDPSPSFGDMEAMIAADPKLRAYVQDMTKAISVPPRAGKMAAYRAACDAAPVDVPRMIRWLEGRIRGWEELEASATSNRLRKQNAWQLLHARAVLAVLGGLP
jgi:hypothetical protein